MTEFTISVRLAGAQALWLQRRGGGGKGSVGKAIRQLVEAAMAKEDADKALADDKERSAFDD
jgi:hypothetical protein